MRKRKPHGAQLEWPWRSRIEDAARYADVRNRISRQKNLISGMEERQCYDRNQAQESREDPVFPRLNAHIPIGPCF